MRQSLSEHCATLDGARDQRLGDLEATKLSANCLAFLTQRVQVQPAMLRLVGEFPERARTIHSLRGMPPALNVPGSATLVSTVRSAKWRNLRRPMDDAYETARSRR
jgi:hypothetical protein